MRRIALLAGLGALLAAQPAGAAPPVVGGVSFNDAAPLTSGTFADAVDTGSAVFYKVRLAAGQRLDTSAAVDVGGLDPSLTGTSSLILRVYGPLREKDAEAQTLGPGDTTTHLKSTSAQVGPVKEAGDYYVSAGVNDFLPDTPQPIRLPLTMTVGVASGGTKPAPVVRRASAGSGTSWGVLAALCAAGILIGGAAGLAYRRR